MRLSRTTRKGTYYESSFSEPPSCEALDALDAVADAAVELLREPLATTRTRRQAGGQPEPEGAPSLDPRGGFRIRPTAPDQDPDPEDAP